MPEHRGYWIYMDGGWRKLRGRDVFVLRFPIWAWLRSTALQCRPRDSARLSIRSDGARSYAKLYQTSQALYQDVTCSSQVRWAQRPCIAQLEPRSCTTGFRRSKRAYASCARRPAIENLKVKAEARWSCRQTSLFTSWSQLGVLTKSSFELLARHQSTSQIS